MTNSSPGSKGEKELAQLQFFCPLQFGPSESLYIRKEDSVPETMLSMSENAGKDHGHVEIKAGYEQEIYSSRQAVQRFQHHGQSSGLAWERTEARHALWCHHQAHTSAKLRAEE